jgi:endonuclease/exonuclease/phosphatase family metal-dependent hydrolase
VLQIPESRQRAIREGARDHASHARWLHELGLDTALDVGGVPSRPAPRGGARRVIAWNLERCKQLEASAALLEGLTPDVVLLSEMDWGMARSGNHHTARELAARLGFTYAFGVEFLELDLGGEAERAQWAGRTNAVGYHGNAILARGEILQPRLVRLERRGDWFDGARGESRVGGRCAVLAQVALAGRPVTFAAVHHESHGTREERALEMQALLDAIDAYAPGAPALIGGDLNCFSLDLAAIGDPGPWRRLCAQIPGAGAIRSARAPLQARARRLRVGSCNALGVPTLRHAARAARVPGSARGALSSTGAVPRPRGRGRA